MELIELMAGRLHLLRFGIGQAYLWQDPGSLTLVDTGPPGSAPRIAEALRGLGYRPGDLTRVILTHFHPDHVGAAAEVSSWGDATVLAHQLDAPVIRGEVPGPPPVLTPAERELHAHIAAAADGFAPAPAARVDIELGHGDTLDFGAGASVVGAPGHTAGSIAVYLPVHRVVLTGDSAARASDGRVILGPFNVDRDQAIASFRRLAELEVDIACFGHGDPVLSGASAELQAVAGQRDFDL